MSEEIRYYKGTHKVKVVTESIGYLTIKAMENFDDPVEGGIVRVKKGQTRIVPASSVYRHVTLPPMVQEHEYDLKMEKKLKRIIAERQKKKSGIK